MTWDDFYNKYCLCNHNAPWHFCANIAWFNNEEIKSHCTYPECKCMMFKERE